MKSYKECCEEVGYEKVSAGKIPKLVPTYFGYEGGKVFPCKTLKESEKYKVRDVGYTKESKAAYDTYWEDQRKLEAAASEMFHALLRAEYSNISDELYNICYSEAYERGHSYGYAEVANYIGEIVDFAEKVRACK